LRKVKIIEPLANETRNITEKCTPGGSNPLKTLVYENIKHT